MNFFSYRFKKQKEQKKSKAFTLAEVTISLGIVSLGLVGILGLLSMGTVSEKQVSSDSKAAIIARRVISDLKADAEDWILGNQDYSPISGVADTVTIANVFRDPRDSSRAIPAAGVDLDNIAKKADETGDGSTFQIPYSTYDFVFFERLRLAHGGRETNTNPNSSISGDYTSGFVNQGASTSALDTATYVVRVTLYDLPSGNPRSQQSLLARDAVYAHISVEYPAVAPDTSRTKYTYLTLLTP